MGSDQLDERTDVYSLGVVVYEMLTGRLPFQSNTPAGYLAKHLMEAPPPFRTIIPEWRVPAAVEAVVMKALAKNRDGRYSTALDFARDFARAVSASNQAATNELPATVLIAPTDRESAEQERLARAKAEADRYERERLAAEQAAREKAEQERLAQEKAEAERREKERLAAEQAAREKAEQERLAQEKAEANRREKERLAAEQAT